MTLPKSGAVEIKLQYRTAGGLLVRSPVTVNVISGRIEFLRSPFALKDEIKAMAGSQWHGFQDPPRKIWSVADCQRNRFQIAYLMGEDVYAWFDQQVKRHEYSRPLMDHQKEMADWFLTYHYGIMAAEMGVGKSLAVQEVMERSGFNNWWWLGPKPSLPNLRREFIKWDMDPTLMASIRMLNYEALIPIMREWSTDEVPQGVVFDESSRLKGENSQRSDAAQMLADLVRETYGTKGYAIEMSGTPSPKSPLDWWKQAEIAWPGFLKEGSRKALEQRLAFMEDVELDAGVFKKRSGWRDDECKCKHCGKHRQDDAHSPDVESDYHCFEPCLNEVALLGDRLKGLVIIKHMKDCVDLPEKRYRTIFCKPNSSTLRAAQLIATSAPNAITAGTLLRELSDGFQYREESAGKTKCTLCKDGTIAEWEDPTTQRTYRAVDLLSPELTARLIEQRTACPQCNGRQTVTKKVRVTKDVPCPKDTAFCDLLDECEETGRIVVFGGFTGTVDRIVKLCHKEGWNVVRLDGRGYQVTNFKDEPVLDEEPLDYWANIEAHPRVAFVAHPESGAMSLTLVESRMAVFYSNSYKPEYRIQAEARIHRIGMDNRGCTIVDLFHLPTDEKVLTIIRENRRLELMSMGDFLEGVSWETT